MITHVVLIRPKVSTTDEELSTFFEHVRELQEQIPGILSMSVGANHSEFNDGFTHGIIMRFDDEAHLHAHHTHPAHVVVVTELDRICQKSIDLDLPETAR